MRLFLCGKRVVIKGEKRGWAKKYEKPLRTVSMLRKQVWETEASLFAPEGGVLYFPPETGPGEVRRILKRMRRRRLLWLLVFSLLLPLTVPLTPIPGPNIPYFYALGRIILHFRSYRSLGKILGSWSLLPFPSVEEYEREKASACI